jgi:hypothetical protein
MRQPFCAVSLRKFVLVVLVLSLFPRGSIGAEAPIGTFCAKPTGLVERNVAYRDSSGSRELAARLAGPNKTFLYMRRTSSHAQVRAAMATLAFASVMLGDKPFGANTPPAEKLTADQLEQIQDLPTLAAITEKEKKTFEDAATEPNWYFYSNSSRFADYFTKQRNLALEDPDRGVLLLMNNEGEKAGLAKVSSEMIKALGAEVVLIEGEGGDDLNPADIKSHPLILRVTDASDSKSSETSMNLYKMIQSKAIVDTTFLFLMPETPEEATAWGFPPDRAEDYVTNGKRILGDLDRYGLSTQVMRIKSRASLAAAVASKPKDHLFVLVGESSDGKTVRVPGSQDTLNSGDFQSLPVGTSFVGLVCNSQSFLGGIPGLSVVGSIYTDAARSVAHILFDRRASDSLLEYIIGPKKGEKPGIFDVIYTASKNMPKSAGGIGPSYPQLFVAEPVPGAIGLFNQPSTSSQPSTTSGSIAPPGSPNDDDHQTLWICLAGVVGALGREIMRWKALTERKRADLFRKPLYIGITVIQLGVAAVAALIFSQLVDGHWKYPVAFVSGAGLEELIRRASMLKMWTPAVPLGPGDTKPSIAEFLRS